MLIRMCCLLLSLFRALHAVLVGPRGTTRARIEKETKALIRIPKKGLDADIGKTCVLCSSVLESFY